MLTPVKPNLLHGLISMILELNNFTKKSQTYKFNCFGSY